MNRKLSLVLVAVVALGAVMAPVTASQTVMQDGTTLGSTDQTNTTVLSVYDDGTVTVQFTGVSSGGDYPTNVTATDATIDSGTVTVNDGNVSVGGSPTSATLNVTFDYGTNGTSDGSVVDYINTSETTNYTLISNPSGTETQTVDVVRPTEFVDVNVSTTNGTFNQSTGEFTPDENATTEFVFAFETRDDAPYEVQNLSFDVAVNRTMFDDIEDVTELNATNGVTLEDVDDGANMSAYGNNSDVYEFRVQNVSASQEIRIRAETVGSGDRALEYGPVVDPKGGQAVMWPAAASIPEEGLAPLALGIPGVGSVALGIVLVVSVLYLGSIYARTMDVTRTLEMALDPFGLASAVIFGLGLSMIVDYVGVSTSIMNNTLPSTSFWLGDVLPSSLPEFTPLVGGVTLIFGGVTLMISDYEMMG